MFCSTTISACTGSGRARSASTCLATRTRSYQNFPSGQLPLGAWIDEEWLIRTVPVGLVLAGKDGTGDPWSIRTSAGSMLAIYVLLDDHLGVHWFWPGPFGEHVPRNANAVVPELSLRATPARRLYRRRMADSHRPCRFGFGGQGRHGRPLVDPNFRRFDAGDLCFARRPSRRALVLAGPVRRARASQRERGRTRTFPPGNSRSAPVSTKNG